MIELDPMVLVESEMIGAQSLMIIANIFLNAWYISGTEIDI